MKCNEEIGRKNKRRTYNKEKKKKRKKKGERERDRKRKRQKVNKQVQVSNDKRGKGAKGRLFFPLYLYSFALFSATHEFYSH